MERHYNTKQIAVALDSWMTRDLILNRKGMVPNAHEFIKFLESGNYPDPFATISDSSQHDVNDLSSRQEVSQNANIDKSTQTNSTIELPEVPELPEDPQAGLVCDSCQ